MDKETFLKYGCNFFNCGSQRCDGSNEWLEGCRHWKKLNEPNLEIERKWLVSGFPEEIQPKKAGERITIPKFNQKAGERRENKKK